MKSPIDGTIIGTRSKLRDHMKRHSVYEAGREFEEKHDRRRQLKYDAITGHDIKRAIEELKQ